MAHSQAADVPVAPLAAAAAALATARRVCVLTGAGISAESGIPTFRDAMTGLWSRFRPEELATPEAFERDPEFVWRWYEERRRRVAAAEPNPGHLALAELERLVPALTLVTQNVDGLHQRAGSRDVHEYHGSLMRDRCTVEGTVAHRAAATSGVPRCARCGGLLRPDVVWFGETIPEAPMRAAREAAATCEVFVSVGTSSVVYPAAGLADVARAAGSTIVEVNPDLTALSDAADIRLAGAAGSMLPRVVALLAAARSAGG
ncbi:MAG: NAD-dependent deacylase [Steroidobacteraceae bacterium]